MNATRYTQAPQQLSAAARIAIAVATVAGIAASVAFAGDASDRAVHVAQASLNPAIRYVVLPSVEVVAKRQADAMDTACALPATPAAPNQI